MTYSKSLCQCLVLIHQGVASFTQAPDCCLIPRGLSPESFNLGFQLPELPRHGTLVISVIRRGTDVRLLCLIKSVERRKSKVGVLPPDGSEVFQVFRAQSETGRRGVGRHIGFSS